MENREKIESQIRKLQQLASQLDGETAARLQSRAAELEAELHSRVEKESSK